MPLSLRLRALNRKTKILLGVLAALTALLLLFEWNWLRSAVEHYYSEKSGRTVKIGHLDVDLGFSLVPTVRLRDVHVENAPWASKRPFVAAEAVTITFSLKSVWKGRPVISRLVIVNADIDMERTAEGLRNWRLREPEPRNPGLFTRRASIRVQGPFRDVRASLGDRVEQPRSAAPEGCNG